MASDPIYALFSVLEVVRPAFTSRTFGRFLILACGWIRTLGRHAITQCLVETGAAGRWHHAGFHRFFSIARWSRDALGQLVLQCCLQFTPGRLLLVIDDTLARKKGPHIYGMGVHLDPVQSREKHKVFSFGHCWVILSLQLGMPFSKRAWSLPLLFRLYIPPKARTTPELRKHTQTKAQLAREMLELILQWCPEREFEVVVDNAYFCAPVMRQMPERVVFTGSIRLEASLTAPFVDVSRQPRKRKGRRPLYGPHLGSVKDVARNSRIPWRTDDIRIGNQVRRVRFKTLCAYRCKSLPQVMLKVVVVSHTQGQKKLRAYASTEVVKTPGELLTTYSDRWSEEVTHRELKQLFGFEDSSAWTQGAVERTAPTVGVLGSLLVVWFRQAYRAEEAWVPIRPWYRHKKDYSFADIVRAAQRTLKDIDPAALFAQYNGTAQKRRMPLKAILSHVRHAA